MKSSILKWTSFVTIGLGIGLYTAFVLECYWNWFAVPVLHFESVSFLQMLGLLWLVQLLINPASDDDEKLKKLTSLIVMSIPEEKQAEIAETMKVDDVMENIFSVIGKLSQNTVMLGLGYLLHLVA